MFCVKCKAPWPYAIQPCNLCWALTGEICGTCDAKRVLMNAAHEQALELNRLLGPGVRIRKPSKAAELLNEGIFGTRELDDNFWRTLSVMNGTRNTKGKGGRGLSESDVIEEEVAELLATRKGAVHNLTNGAFVKRDLRVAS